jgi:hypothetical protein
MGSPTTLDHDVITAWNDLKAAERRYRDGLIADHDLEAARQRWRPYARNPDRWVQPTVPELRAQGQHGEADRIRGLQHDTAGYHGPLAFDRLNPEFGVPADHHNPYGRKAGRDREAALALGPRVAVAASRENDPAPVVWLAGQDYRVADAIQAARRQPIRQPAERAGAER